MVNNVETLQRRLSEAMPDPLTVAKVAKRVGCSVTHLMNIRSGRFNPSLPLAGRLSQELKIPLKTFVFARTRDK